MKNPISEGATVALAAVVVFGWVLLVVGAGIVTLIVRCSN